MGWATRTQNPSSKSSSRPAERGGRENRSKFKITDARRFHAPAAVAAVAKAAAVVGDAASIAAAAVCDLDAKTRAGPLKTMVVLIGGQLDGFSAQMPVAA